MAKATRKTKAKPAAPKPAAVQHPDTNWIISPPSSSFGGELLKRLKRAINYHEVLDEHQCPSRAGVALSAGYDIASTIAHVLPQGAEEALAAATLLYAEAESFECVEEWPEKQRREVILRMRQRASALADWIETTHKIDRREFRLDYFCPSDARDEVHPHGTSMLKVHRPSVAAA